VFAEGCIGSELEVCLFEVLEVVLCCRLSDPVRPIDPVPDALRILPVLLTGRGMIDVSSTLGALFAATAAGLK
jgi:hypothetical protein